MSIESPDDWDGLRKVSRVVRLILDALERNVRPGITTGELDEVAGDLLKSHNSRSAPAVVYGFPGNVLISINDEIVHGVPGPRRIQRGDIVKLDVTVEKGGYVADAARSMVVESRVASSQRLVDCAKAAFDAALDVARAGNKVNEIGRAVEREVKRQGFTVVAGLSGHGVGRTIHEPPDVLNEYDPRQRDVLTDGLVITIEPMIATGSSRAVKDRNGWTMRTKDGGLSAHYEHTLVITKSEPVILTAA